MLLLISTLDVSVKSMIIKLFLITLLCATLVFGNPPVQKFRDAREKPVNELISEGNYFMDHGSLVRRSAQGPPGPPGGSPGGPPRGSMGGPGGSMGRSGGSTGGSIGGSMGGVGNYEGGMERQGK